MIFNIKFSIIITSKFLLYFYICLDKQKQIIMSINKVIRLLDTRLRNSFVMSKDDFNINVKFVEERNDFCIIYHIDIE